jgi:glyoxylase-like metal-dependent hydrolase (beta-lactamase superfamily II)
MGDGITLIDEPHIHTFCRCTCWHIRGGGIALREAASGVLISGDLIHDGPLIEDTYHSDAADYARSMRRPRDLPARIVHSGHFPSFSRDRQHSLIDDLLRAKRL